MFDALWPMASVVACAFGWDAWRRWLAQSREDYAERLAAVELQARQLHTELNDLRAVIGKNTLAGTVAAGPRVIRR
jgi:hypothetical protein